MFWSQQQRGRRVCTRQAAAAEEPLKSKQRAIQGTVPCRPELLHLSGHSAPNHYCHATAAGLRWEEVAGSGAEPGKQGTREHLVDALGPSAPTPAASRLAHVQWMAPLAQRSLLRVRPLVQKCVGRIRLSCCAVSFKIDDRLRRGEIWSSNRPPLRVQRMNNGLDRVVLLFFFQDAIYQTSACVCNMAHVVGLAHGRSEGFGFQLRNRTPRHTPAQQALRIAAGIPLAARP